MPPPSSSSDATTLMMGLQVSIVGLEEMKKDSVDAADILNKLGSTFKNAAAGGLTGFNKSMGEAVNQLRLLKSAKGLDGLIETFTKIGKVSDRASMGLPNTLKSVNKLIDEARDKHHNYMKEFEADWKKSGRPLSEARKDLEAYHRTYKQHMSMLREAKREAVNDPSLMQRLLGSMRLTPTGYMAMSRGLRDLQRGGGLQGLSYGLQTISQGGIQASEDVARMSVYRGSGSLGEGRAATAGLMRAGPAGVSAGTAQATVGGLISAGWSIEDSKGPLGQAVAGLVTSRGVSAEAAIGLAEKLRASGMSASEAALAMMNIRKRGKFGADAVAGISAGVTGAMTQLQQRGFNRGVAVDAMSRMQSIMTSGMGNTAQASQYASSFVENMGKSFGDKAFVAKLAGTGITPSAMTAALRGDLGPLLGQLKALKGRDSTTIHRVAEAFQLDPNALGMMISNSKNFDEGSTTRSFKDLKEAQVDNTSAIKNSTNIFEKIVSRLSLVAQGVNNMLGGVPGQMYNSGFMNNAMASLYVGQALWGMGKGMGKAVTGKIGGMFGGRLGEWGARRGASFGAGWNSRSSRVGAPIAFPDGTTGTGPANRSGFRGLSAVGMLGRGASLATRYGLPGLGAGLAFKDIWDSRNDVDTNGYDTSGKLMEGIGGTLTTAGLLSSATGIGAAWGVPMAGFGTALSIIGGLTKGLGGTGHRAEDGTESPLRGGGNTGAANAAQVQSADYLRQVVAQLAYQNQLMASRVGPPSSATHLSANGKLNPGVTPQTNSAGR